MTRGLKILGMTWEIIGYLMDKRARQELAERWRQVKKIREHVFQVIGDVIKMPSALNMLAKEHESEGYKVERGIAGVVILKLADGEVHFIPAGSIIKEVLFAY